MVRVSTEDSRREVVMTQQLHLSQPPDEGPEGEDDEQHDGEETTVVGAWSTACAPVALSPVPPRNQTSVARLR